MISNFLGVGALFLVSITSSGPSFTKVQGNELCAIQAYQDIYEKRGCCSHHKGVCGCNNGRAVCCDGTSSPTCGC